jgi:hypothetical protein
VFGLSQPVIQAGLSMLGQHGHKRLGELIRGLQVSMSCTDLLNLPSLLLVQDVCATDIQKGGLVLESGDV